MRRREFIVFLGGAVAALPLGGVAQQPGNVPTIGYLSDSSPANPSPHPEPFRQGLRDLGYIEGKNITMEYRYAEGVVERLPHLAAELARLKVDVIFTGGAATIAAKDATKTIPIVMTNISDPVVTGLVTSLAHPGGNITGLAIQVPGLGGKRLELLKEALPRVSRVALLWNLNNRLHTFVLEETQVAAEALGVTLQPLEVRGPNDFEPVFSAMNRDRASALIVLSDPVTNSYRTQILDFVAKSRLPAMYMDKAFTDAGGLMSYGPNRLDLSRRAATYVDKILKGAKPADLPVEQPTEFELVINLKTAKALGLTLPLSLLIRADEVLE